jgi:hypothetical protein
MSKAAPTRAVGLSVAARRTMAIKLTMAYARSYYFKA